MPAGEAGASVRLQFREAVRGQPAEASLDCFATRDAARLLEAAAL